MKIKKVREIVRPSLEESQYYLCHQEITLNINEMEYLWFLIKKNNESCVVECVYFTKCGAALELYSLTNSLNSGTMFKFFTSKHEGSVLASTVKNKSKYRT